MSGASAGKTDLYDAIGRGYADLRRPDPRIAAAIGAALGDARSIVNVGAGAGSYEPKGQRVVAVEPSVTMIRQRPSGAAPAVRASASALPFADGSFDAALAVLTLHHWPDKRAGITELRRVARRRVVVLSWDESESRFWLDDYFPELREVDRGIFPSFAEMEGALGSLSVSPVPIPHDCSDGFLGAYWRRPEAYLDARVRGAISTFSKIDAVPGLERLRADLASGEWRRRYGALTSLAAIDLGYRLIVARCG